MTKIKAGEKEKLSAPAQAEARKADVAGKTTILKQDNVGPITPNTTGMNGVNGVNGAKGVNGIYDKPLDPEGVVYDAKEAIKQGEPQVAVQS